MIHPTAALGNVLWWASARPAARTFRRGASAARGIQEAWLRATLHRNADTRYGRRFGFDRIKTVEDWQDRVPIVRYEDLEPDIEAIRAGATGILTAEPVRLLQPTSGSTGGSKLIPYTDRLRAEYRRAVAVWMDNLFRAQPGLAAGRAYWSISPDVEDAIRRPSHVPIGFDEDAAYLGETARRLVRRLAVVPADVKLIRDLDAFRYTTLRFLLGAPDLRLISVWNPTFLSLLLQPLACWWEDLQADICRGTLTPPGPVDDVLLRTLHAGLTPSPRRAAVLAECGPRDYRHIWPHVRLISCWADGSSRTGADVLREEFPGVVVQPKGLIATEAFLTIPLIEGSGAVPAFTSHFFEFIPQAAPGGGSASEHQDRPSGAVSRAGHTHGTSSFESGPEGAVGQVPALRDPNIRHAPRSRVEALPASPSPSSGSEVAIDRRPLLLDELEEGSQYEIVVTTGGGLYRYRMGDIVEVVGRYRGLPRLQFVGRAGLVSDRFGEKLDEGFVSRVLGSLIQRHGLRLRFSMLAPEEGAGGVRYIWFVEEDAPAMDTAGMKRTGLETPGHAQTDGLAGKTVDTRRSRLADDLEQALSANFHYAVCRRLGQLQPAFVTVVSPGAADAYLRHALSAGRRLGDIKIPALDPDSGWSMRFLTP